MSRVGKEPVSIPSGVEVTMQTGRLNVKGPKGELARTVPSAIDVSLENGVAVVKRASESKQHKALHGLLRTLLNNMVIGVSQGFEKSLDLVGVGYRAQKEGNDVTLLIGYSHPVIIKPLDGIQLDVEGQNRIIVSGIDKEMVGEMAARIRRAKRPNAYTGAGIRYTNERVRLKPGKAAARK
jgi:large subunit ribosomal protein L6